MSFKNYAEAAFIAESLFGKLFGRGKKPKEEPKTPEEPKINIDVIDRGSVSHTDKAEKENKIKDVDAMNRRFEPGNLFQVLNFYNTLLGDSQYHYPPDLVRKISQSSFANELWDSEYREMFMKTYKNPVMVKVLL